MQICILILGLYIYLVLILYYLSLETASIFMQRSPVNGFNLEFLQEFRAVIKDLELRDYRGVIITSSLPKVFSGGLDFKELYQPNEIRLRLFWKSLQELWRTLYISPLVTIAAVNGHAPAGGCLLSMSCDHSIMVKTNYTIGLPASKVGLPAPKWLCDMFINALGFHRAEHAIKSAELFSPQEALKLSLVDELVDSHSDLLSRAEERLDEWLKIPRESFKRTKLQFRQSFVDELSNYEEEETEELVKVMLLEETQKTLKRYMCELKK